MKRGPKTRQPAPLRPPPGDIQPCESVQADPDALKVFRETIQRMRDAGTLDATFQSAVESFALLSALRTRALRTAAKTDGPEGLRWARFASGAARLQRSYECDLCLNPRSRERCKLPPAAARPELGGALQFLKRGGFQNDR